MQSAGYQLFARPAFSGYQHGSRGIGHIADHIKYLLHGFAFSDDFREQLPRVHLATQHSVFILQHVEHPGVADGDGRLSGKGLQKGQALFVKLARGHAAVHINGAQEPVVLF